MPKGTILDRLAGAMKTLGKREGKSMTPRQRVAAAQRWNSLADVGEKRFLSADERAASFDPITAARGAVERDNIERKLAGMRLIGNDGWTRADNPFLSEDPAKYAEQSQFLDWCRYNGLEPNGRNLKTFRWERYKKMSVPNREIIYDNYDLNFLPEERMWYSRSDMPDYLPVGWDNSSNWRY